MYKGPTADYHCYLIEREKIGSNVLNNIEYKVDWVNDDWYEHSFITVAGEVSMSKRPTEVELLHTIYVICTKIVQQTGQGTCEDIMVSKCEQHGENELWFVVKYQHKYTFAQCRYFKANNRLEIHIVY